MARTSTRPPIAKRVSTAAARYTRAGAISPAESLMSTTAGSKRKERGYEHSDAPTGDETCINVFVRCRGRNDREVKENSNVVLQTEGVKGKLVELSMGPSALSNKTYSFDGVFSPAAGQSMIYDEVVKPILDEMLAGYNCTIFAYGQTGTGKTYTMSGDMSETLGILSDAAGIIPRVLQALFNKLQVDSGENCVKVSFIELYNEDLRDLISVEENAAKLKIFDDVSKKGHAATVVQGMEEMHIASASDGIRVLQEGSLRRQVAATKCNDLSSRSHTVFTITAYVRVPGSDGGEEFVSAGKLNLVDLAGSENIQRSGAENKRAAEAGLINKSLLTLGRVINALVDRSLHIPYRESKLTRLLQDSLGGRTKTCIIATVSPAKSNLEETISTLDYAFRAKNIRNRPQINQPIHKKALLKDFAMEIERLKRELICHRQRNGVYLTNDAYEDLNGTNESRRIMLEEQAAKMETLETSLRNKVQELLTLTATFMGLKKDHESTRVKLDETETLLDQTELVLAATRKTLAEETHLRRAHQETEKRLAEAGSELLATVQRAAGDVEGLRAKNRRKSDLQALNRGTWAGSQARVAEVTGDVEGRVRRLRDEQAGRIAGVAGRMRGFVEEELRLLAETGEFLDGQLARFGEARGDLLGRGERSKEDMDGVLEEIKEVRDAVTERVSESLQAISAGAERIAQDVLSELDTFHDQLFSSYNSLGKEFKAMFEDLSRHLASQRSESDRLRRQLQLAAREAMEKNDSVSQQLQDAIDEERRQAAEDRQNLLTQIGALIAAQTEKQEARLAEKAALLRGDLSEANTALGSSVDAYGEEMDGWDKRQGEVLDEVKKSRDAIRTQLTEDWNTANEHSGSIRATTKSVHAETVRVVDKQMTDLDEQMQALDDFVTRARSENAQHHGAQVEAVHTLSATVEESYDKIEGHFATAFDRVKALGEGVEADAGAAGSELEALEEEVCEPLATLRAEVRRAALREYEPTGETPEKVAYQYPRKLPRTGDHAAILARLHEAEAEGDAEDEVQGGGGSPNPVLLASATPSKPRTSSLSSAATVVYSDSEMGPPDYPALAATGFSPVLTRSSIPAAMGSSGASLREINPNLTATSFAFEPASAPGSMSPPQENATLPMLKRGARGRAGKKGTVAAAAAAGRRSVDVGGEENMVDLGMPRRKSPRLN